MRNFKKSLKPEPKKTGKEATKKSNILASSVDTTGDETALNQESFQIK